MKNIFSFLKAENLKKNLTNVVSRFPVSVIIIVLTAILFFVELHYSREISDLLNDRILALILSLIITFFFSVSVYVSSENTDKSSLQKNIYQVIPIAFGALFYLVYSLDVDNFENIIFFILSLTGIVSYLFFAPYIKSFFKNEESIKQSTFYTYFYDIATLILISFILGGVLFALGAIAIGSVETLFELDIDYENSYGNWAIIALSVITPLFALSKIPEKKDFLADEFKENAFFSFLTKYIAIPFIYLYFFILYAYSIKVLLNFSDWPRGEVSWMVIGFSIFGYLIYIFSYIFEKENKTVNIFRKLFPYVVIPQLFMLFYAIYLRINQYDLTVNRYFVVVFGIWLAVISVYYILSKKKYLYIIPTVLTLFTILISIGPWGVYSLPESRQLTRLENNLKEASILENGTITPLETYSDISQDLSKNIYSGIDYLCDFNSCEDIKNLFPKIYADIYEQDKLDWEEARQKDIENYLSDSEKYSYLEDAENRVYKGPSKWEIVAGITKTIKVKNYFYDRDISKYIRFNKEYEEEFFPMDVSDYSKIYLIKKYNTDLDMKDTYATYNADNSTIEFLENETKTTIDIKEITDSLKEKGDSESTTTLDKDDLIFEVEQDGNFYKLFFEEINIKTPEYNEVDNENYIPYYYVNGYLLVK